MQNYMLTGVAKLYKILQHQTKRIKKSTIIEFFYTIYRFYTSRRLLGVLHILIYDSSDKCVGMASSCFLPRSRK